MRKRAANAVWSPSLVMSLLLLCGLASFAQGNSSSSPTVRRAVAFEVSAPVRELATLPMPPNYVIHTSRPLRPSQRRPAEAVLDTVEQSATGGGPNFEINYNQGGIGSGFNGFNTSFNYPDANIAVGDTQIVQWANNSFAVFDKAGNALSGAIPFNLFWTSGQCSTYNPEGHPIAQWDRFAHQWLFAENVVTGGPNNYSGYACVAVSTGSNAMGAYYLYQFSLGNGYPDLAKWGIWSNSFFQSNDNFGPDARTFIGAYECAYDSAKMLVGDQTAEQLCFQLTPSDFALMPADIDSPAQPPPGEDEFLFSLWDNSNLALYSFHVDWSTVTGSITGGGGTQLFPVPAFTPACNGQYLGACVPQKNVPPPPPLLDVLGDRLLYRVAYYNGVPPKVPPTALPPSFQHWLVLHDVTASGGNTAERWYEFVASTKSIPVTSIQLLQSGTYAPDSSNHRWMGSIARDMNGNIMMAYSESSDEIYPSIAITGRLVSDPAGTMEPELPVFNGTGAYSGTFDYDKNRWGDYTSMRLDPADNCMFWYTNEYYTVTGTSNWSTRINSACFKGCGECIYVDWTQFHFDSPHTGFNPYEYILSPASVVDLKVHWRTGPIIGVSSPAVVNGVVYVGSDDDNLYAVNATTGAILWTYPTGNYVESSPAVANGVVYFGSDDFNLYALNASTGAFLWKFPTGSFAFSSPTVVNGVVYFGSEDNNLYALNANTGALLWKYTTGSYVASSPAVANGVVYFGSDDFNLYALNASTGAFLWKYTTGGFVYSSPAVANGVVYVGSVDNNMYALNASTGALLWQYPTTASVYASPATANGVVYVGSGQPFAPGIVYALNATTGALIWQYTNASQVFASPAVANGVVYFGAGDDNLYALDASTGALLWNQSLGGSIASSPAIANGVVYITSGVAALYALGL